MSPASPAVARVLRLRPGEDLRGALSGWLRDEGLGAACVASCVGSLVHASLRFADRPHVERIDGPLEIVGLVGTLSPDGPHLHLTVSDARGAVRAGHLGFGAPVRTTAEVVLLALPGLVFTREPDAATGFRELVVRPSA